jgi:hypothetical protein
VVSHNVVGYIISWIPFILCNVQREFSWNWGPSCDMKNGVVGKFFQIWEI